MVRRSILGLHAASCFDTEQGDFPNSVEMQDYTQTFTIADTTASMFLWFSAATQIRPESTP
jgi:hypothetical protein